MKKITILLISIFLMIIFYPSICPAPIGPIFRYKLRVEEHSENATIERSRMYGERHTNTGATALITFTLPRTEVGLFGCFEQTDPNGISIVPLDPNDQIDLLTNTAGDSITTTSGVGSFICLECLEAGHWMPKGRNGSWSDTD